MAKTTKQATYQELHQELEQVLSDLQQDGTDIDRAMELHSRGQTLIKQLQEYLVSAENKITELQAPVD